MSKKTEFIVKCNDGCSLLLVNEDDNFISFCAYELGAYEDHRVSSFRQKIRWIKNFIKTGKPYTDWMLLTKKEAIKFRNNLDILIKELEDN